MRIGKRKREVQNKLRIIRSKRALSPIFATLILIAIAVIAGIVVYMFTSGYLSSMMGGGPAAQEKMAVQSVQYEEPAAGNYKITLLVQNTGTVDGVATGIIVRDASGNTVASITTGLTGTTLTHGALATVVGTGAAASLPDGSYTATVATEAGSSFVSTSFTVG